MTNGNRFAIYLSSFHLVDLWCTGGDRGWILEGQSEDLELFDWGREERSWAQCFALYCQFVRTNKEPISHLSRRGWQAGGGERGLALHLSPAVGNLYGHLVQVGLALQGGVKGTAGLCQTRLQ